jgi:hypothetical protein
MKKAFLLANVAALYAVSSVSSADTASILDSSTRRSQVCPDTLPLYCPAVNWCCPENKGYYCTKWESLPEPSPLARPLIGPCLNINAFSVGQQEYLERYCEPHGCG